MRMHHVGYVVRDLLKFQETMPLLETKKIVFDPVQNAKIGLFSAGGGCFVELIEPTDESSFTWNFLRKNGESIHHVCYEGFGPSDIEQIIRDHRMLRLRGPLYANLFERDVVFAMTRSRAIIEFLL